LKDECLGLSYVFCLFYFSIAKKMNYERQKSFIYLQPIGKIDQIVLDNLISPIETCFDLPCKIAEPLSFPDYAYNSKRGQYLSTAILEQIRKAMPKDANKVLGIVDLDLYVPNLNFVFGEADMINGVCIISIIRLRQKFYRLPENKELFIERTIKEAIHELGHTFGLYHCSNPNCVMFFSNSLLDTDRKGKNFCKVCAPKLNR
jgi:archaemetzincin